MTATATETISDLRSKARANWRTWAHALSSSGKLPPMRELADAASLLGRTIDDLEKDAATIREYEATVQERDFWKAALDKVEAERGPIEDVRKQIEETEQQLADLRDLERAGHGEGWRLGTAKANVEKMRKKRPDLFADA